MVQVASVRMVAAPRLLQSSRDLHLDVGCIEMVFRPRYMQGLVVCLKAWLAARTLNSIAGVSFSRWHNMISVLASDTGRLNTMKAFTITFRNISYVPTRLRHDAGVSRVQYTPHLIENNRPRRRLPRTPSFLPPTTPPHLHHFLDYVPANAETLSECIYHGREEGVD